MEKSGFFLYTNTFAHQLTAVRFDLFLLNFLFHRVHENSEVWMQNAKYCSVYPSFKTGNIEA